MANVKYCPVLRWKRGEQTALTNLFPAQKETTKPILNLIAHSFDPPNGNTTDNAFDQRLDQDADRLSAAWAGYTAAVDLGDIDPEARCEGGIHPIRSFFDRLNGSGSTVNAQPVLRMESDNAYITAVAGICSTYHKVPVIRLTLADLAEPDIDNYVRELLDNCNTPKENSDLVLDMGYINQIGISTIMARGALSAAPFINDWATVALVGGSFPENLSAFVIGVHEVPRIEWDVWLNSKNTVNREVIYGDYATIHPIVAEEDLDPRTINPTASVRYTFDELWTLLRGRGTRSRGSTGFAQFYNHADTLFNMPQYRGEGFSYGDAKIARIHRREEAQGNLETWVTIGVNHHIAEVVDLISSLP